MIKGIGIDLVDIEKIKNIFRTRKERFCLKVFSEQEINSIENSIKKNCDRGIQKAAGYFAAKEAFLKATGRGLFSVPLNKIMVLNNENGQPYIDLGINIKANISSVKVSITHDKGFACAVVVVQ